MPPPSQPLPEAVAWVLIGHATRARARDTANAP